MKPVITSVRYYSTKRRPKPKAGDRRVTKKHGLQIRVWDVATNWRGDVIGHRVSNGRPCYSWVCPKDLRTSDRWYLTPEERAHYFPNEYAPGVVHGCGHMQQRGAA